MTFTGIIILLVLGLVLLLIEILVLPGTTVIGIIGGALMVAGIYFAFAMYGTMPGLYTLGIAGTVTLVAIILAFRAGTWNRFTLHKQLDGKANVIEKEAIQVGAEGLAISRLAPMGTADFGGALLEVSTNGEFVNANTKIVIVALENNRIIVSSKT